jgi:hypothetical protein
MCSSGPEGKLRAGDGVRELLSGLARRVGGRAVDGQGVVGVRAGDEGRCVVGECRRARGRGGAQVGEFLDFAEELVKDGALEQPAKMLALDPGVVDAQFAAEGRFERFQPKQDGDFTARVVEAGAGGAVEGPPLVGCGGAGEFRSEDRGATGGGKSLGAPGGGRLVHAKLRCGGAAEVRVAIGRDIGEFPRHGVGLEDGKNIANSTLVVRGSQLAGVELQVARQELDDGNEQGEGANLNGHAPCWGGMGEQELRWGGAYKGGRGINLLRYQNS